MSKKQRRKDKKQKRRQEKIRKELAARRLEARKLRKQEKEIEETLDSVGEPETVQVGPVKPFDPEEQKQDSPPYLTHNKQMLDDQKNEG
jgi:hypothetical protein